MTLWRRPPRRGAALILVLVTLGVIGAILATTAAQVRSGRLSIECRRHQLQAAWLARSGIELACAKLLPAPAGYAGETVEILSGGRVHVHVHTDPKDAERYRIESEARYPADSPNVVLRRCACTVRRVTGAGGARLEIQPATVAGGL